MAAEPKTTVYVLTRNRPRLLRQAIVSVLAQDTPVRLVVSDNSTDDESWKFIQMEFPAVQVVRRVPSLIAHDHFNAILAEVDTAYLVMFHDDDVMLPGFVRALEAQISQNVDCVAVACNAAKLQDETVAHATVMGRFSQPVDIWSPTSLLSHYMEKLPLGPAPFPAYLYRVEAVRGLQLIPDEGGKYADVSFLCKAVERGRLRWIPDVLMRYRYHSGKDSNRPDMSATRALINFVCARYAAPRRGPTIMLFRYRMWRQWTVHVKASKELARRFPWRLRVARRRVLLGLLILMLRNPRLVPVFAQSLFLARGDRLCGRA